jgi:tRNA (cmo5U34)-methyltransferase
MYENLEEMSAFFDDRVDDYDQHMQGLFQNINFYYGQIVKPIIRTENPVKILDLGCGTGKELSFIFQKVPNAKITAVDLSEGMLKKLMERYPSYLEQIQIVQESYLTMPFQESYFDYVISVYTMHHFTPDVKRALYKKIKRALKPKGKYIEGDSVVELEKEKFLMDRYNETLESIGSEENDLFHIDIPCSLQTQVGLFHETGFSNVKVIYHNEDEESAIFVVQT